MWILNQRRDKLINVDNVKQIRCFEDGEITADGTVLGKYKDPDKVMGAICNSISSELATIIIMPEDSPDDR